MLGLRSSAVTFSNITKGKDFGGRGGGDGAKTAAADTGSSTVAAALFAVAFHGTELLCYTSVCISA